MSRNGRGRQLGKKMKVVRERRGGVGQQAAWGHASRSMGFVNLDGQ
jgi:hypothetical protein